jgi:outer membrane murein-binding lipoprotein Lpp
MNKNTFRMKTLGLVALAGALVSGCATNGDIEEVRKMAADAQAASSRAEQAASSAQATAERAEASAQDANSCCAANTEKLERVFQRSMRK